MEQPLSQLPAASSPLDQLEAQVNLVLEHTGRIFASSARSTKGNAPVSNPARLRQVFSGAVVNFHDALDVLEAELAVARAVMRRDLAVCRTALETQTSDARSEEQTAVDDDAKVKDEHADTEVSQQIDVDMTGDTPKLENVSPPRDDFETMQDAPPDTESQQPEQSTDQPEPKQPPLEPLQLDIPSGEHQGTDNPTDATTGTYSHFDFESLFNDPSANTSPSVQLVESPQKIGEQATVTPAPPLALTSEPLPAPVPPVPVDDSAIEKPNKASEPDSNPSNDDMNTTDTFDFGDMAHFGNSANVDDGNDNISSLLPGLESYANAPDQPQTNDSQPDVFNIFDAVGGPDFGANTAPAVIGDQSAEAKPVELDQQGVDQGLPIDDQRDDTFDALMNFDNFDMGSFGGGDDDDGKTAFDASFFDIS